MAFRLVLPLLLVGTLASSAAGAERSGLDSRVRAVKARVSREVFRAAARIKETGPKLLIKRLNVHQERLGIGATPTEGTFVIAGGLRERARLAGRVELRALAGVPGPRAAKRRAILEEQVETETFYLTDALEGKALGVALAPRPGLGSIIVIDADGAYGGRRRITGLPRDLRGTLAHERTHVADYGDEELMAARTAVSARKGPDAERGVRADHLKWEGRADAGRGRYVGMTGRAPRQGHLRVGADAAESDRKARGFIEGYVGGARARMLADPRVTRLSPGDRTRAINAIDAYLVIYRGEMVQERGITVGTAPDHGPGTVWGRRGEHTVINLRSNAMFDLAEGDHARGVAPPSRLEPILALALGVRSR